ncbi:dipeptidyl aminopeptidase [Rhodoplanes elegans]|uniref:Dipeptidyl aminopeptidase n=1 Tax=Rhodoplanes elegans TaxID=29408 RepID=A0A327K699_9BRAD|nr:alpha/beta fold hydrolase [Rhodoplanes elegans]MBK5961535.1 dipeptidyl aminopeptidase [Rhodoplanes elegans]RAI33466.1 dipeptidyl aminopeptidase [Rhodoplanes elegans]
MSSGPLLIGLAAAVVAVLGLRWILHRALLRGLRAPRVPHDCGPLDLGLPADCVRELSIEGPRDKRLFAWLVTPDPTPDAKGNAPGDAPGDAATGSPCDVAVSPLHPAVLVMHGWGSNAAMMLPVVAPLRAAGFAVLLVDARCHGRSDDEDFASMPRFAEDIAAGLGVLRAQPGIAADRIALIGHSVGAGAALLAACRDPAVTAVVSVSAFAHPGEIMRGWLARARIPYPVIGWYLLRHVERTIGARFADIAPVATIRRVGCPVLVVHGRHDTTVPFADAERLVAAGTQATLLAIDGDHDLRDALGPHAAAVAAFLVAACSTEPRAITSTRSGMAAAGLA